MRWKPDGQHVQQEATQELVELERQQPLLGCRGRNRANET